MRRLAPSAPALLSWLLAVVATSAGCLFDFQRTADLSSGDVSGRAVRGPDPVAPAPFAHVSTSGIPLQRRAASDGAFLERALPVGSYATRLSDDVDGDGWPERTGLRGFVIRTVTHKEGLFGEQERTTFVMLGDVLLEGSASVRGAVSVKSGGGPLTPAVGARVLVVRELEVPAAEGEGLVAMELGAEAETATDDAGGFRFPKVGAGRFSLVVVVDPDGPGGAAPQVSTPFEVMAAIGEDIVVDTLEVDLDELPTERRVELSLSPPPAEGERVLVRFESPGSEPTAPAAGDFDLQREGVYPASPTLEVTAPVGVFDVYAFTSDGQRGALLGRVTTPPGRDVVRWGTLVLSAGERCAGADATGAAIIDCDGDGLQRLPLPGDALFDDVAGPCGSACEDRFGAAAGDASCEAAGEVWDCDDDGDGQPDVTEPPACRTPSAGDDRDGDGLCSAMDPFPQCAENAPSAPACSASRPDTFHPPPLWPDFGGEERDAGPSPDAGPPPDAGHEDGGPVDSGDPDSGPDSGVVDGGHLDGGPVDSGDTDGGPDSGVVDGGDLDGGPVDSGDTDGGPDGGVDAGAVDAGDDAGEEPDAGSSGWARMIFPSALLQYNDDMAAAGGDGFYLGTRVGGPFSLNGACALADIGTGPLAAVLLHYGEDGECRWVKAVKNNVAGAGTPFVVVRAVAATDTHVFFIVEFMSSVSLGLDVTGVERTFTPPGSNTQTLVARYRASDGELDRVTRLGPNGTDPGQVEIRDAVAFPSGDLVLVGNFTSTVVLNPDSTAQTTLIGSTTTDLFVAGYDEDAVPRWAVKGDAEGSMATAQWVAAAVDGQGTERAVVYATVDGSLFPGLGEEIKKRESEGDEFAAAVIGYDNLGGRLWSYPVYNALPIRGVSAAAPSGDVAFTLNGTRGLPVTMESPARVPVFTHTPTAWAASYVAVINPSDGFLRGQPRVLEANGDSEVHIGGLSFFDDNSLASALDLWEGTLTLQANSGPPVTLSATGSRGLGVAVFDPPTTAVGLSTARWGRMVTGGCGEPYAAAALSNGDVLIGGVAGGECSEQSIVLDGTELSGDGGQFMFLWRAPPSP